MNSEESVGIEATERFGRDANNIANALISSIPTNGLNKGFIICY